MPSIVCATLRACYVAATGALQTAQTAPRVALRTTPQANFRILRVRYAHVGCIAQISRENNEERQDQTLS
jgi:hypothetical protein